MSVSSLLLSINAEFAVTNFILWVLKLRQNIAIDVQPGKLGLH